VAYVDFRAAFYSVNRQSWLLLKTKGVPQKLVDLLEDLYTNTASSRRSSLRLVFDICRGAPRLCCCTTLVFRTNQWRSEGCAGVRRAGHTGQHLLGAANGRKFKKKSRENSYCKLRDYNAFSASTHWWNIWRTTFQKLLRELLKPAGARDMMLCFPSKATNVKLNWRSWETYWAHWKRWHKRWS